jgi:hypothetical protein
MLYVHGHRRVVGRVRILTSTAGAAEENQKNLAASTKVQSPVPIARRSVAYMRRSRDLDGRRRRRKPRMDRQRQRLDRHPAGPPAIIVIVGLWSRGRRGFSQLVGLPGGIAGREVESAARETDLL